MENEKKNKVLEVGKKSNKKIALIMIVIAVILGGAIYLVFGREQITSSAVAELKPMDYKGLRVDKQIVTPIEEGDLIGVSLADLVEYRMLYFKWKDKPLLVYADQKGRIITSIAMCEPCRNDEDFFIQDNLLVCGKCWTKWKLTSHMGVSGGCKKYPPAIIDHEVRNGNIFMKKADIDNWKPRV